MLGTNLTTAYNKATIISNNVSSVNSISPGAVFQSITNENVDRSIKDIQRVSKIKITINNTTVIFRKI